MEDKTYSADEIRNIVAEVKEGRKREQYKRVANTTFFKETMAKILAAANNAETKIQFSPHPFEFFQDLADNYRQPADKDRVFTDEEMETFDVLETVLGYTVHKQFDFPAAFEMPNGKAVTYNINIVNVMW